MIESQVYKENLENHEEEEKKKRRKRKKKGKAKKEKKKINILKGRKKEKRNVK